MKSYFSHDEGARNDPKLVKVLMRLGQAGKGVYWDLVEMLYEQGGYLLLSEIESYSFGLRAEPALVTQLINDFGLFVSDADKFWSETVLRRIQLRAEKSERRAAAGAKGGKIRAEREAIAKAELEQSLSNDQAMLGKNESMLEQSLSNKSKVKESKVNTPSLCSGGAGKEAPDSLPAKKNKSQRTGAPPAFADFWHAYPRKESKATALKAFEKLTEEEQTNAAGWARDFFARRTDWLGPNKEDFRPHAATWLNQQRWKDLQEVTITPTHGTEQPNPPNPHGFVNHEKREAGFTILAGLEF